MIKVFYQIIEFDAFGSITVVSTGLTKEIAEYGLECDNIRYRSVHWLDVPIYNQQANAEIYRGVLER